MYHLGSISDTEAIQYIDKAILYLRSKMPQQLQLFHDRPHT